MATGTHTTTTVHGNRLHPGRQALGVPTGGSERRVILQTEAITIPGTSGTKTAIKVAKTNIIITSNTSATGETMMDI